MKILVTGGTGFIGSYMANHLQKNGHDVTICDNNSRGVLDSFVNKLKFIECDLTDKSQLDKLDTDFVQLETAHKNLRSDINNISREISRRQAIHQREARGSSINKRSFSSSNKGTSNNYNEGGGGSRWTR